MSEFHILYDNVLFQVNEDRAWIHFDKFWPVRRRVCQPKTNDIYIFFGCLGTIRSDRSLNWPKNQFWKRIPTVRHFGNELFWLASVWKGKLLQFLHFRGLTLWKINNDPYHPYRSCDSLMTIFLADNYHKKLVMFYYCRRRAARRDLRVAFQPPCKEWSVVSAM